MSQRIGGGGRSRYRGITFHIEHRGERSAGNREIGNHPDSSSPVGWVKEEGMSRGYESSSEESVEEENNLVGRDRDESTEEDENRAEDNIGDVDTDEEEDGAVTG